MRFFTALRSLFASYIVPGWGLWIAGRRKLAIATVVTFVALILFFSWSRLVLNPTGYLVLVGAIIFLQTLTAFSSAVLEFLRENASSPPRNWQASFIFAAISFGAMLVVLANRPATLGYDVFRQPSASMAPTILHGDYYLTDAWHYSDNEPLFGELVVFEVPGQDGVKYMKRVVGLPGDTLSLRNSEFRRNGVLVAEPYAVYSSDRPGRMGDFSELVVPDGEYFVMGDNRNNSRDSRYIGTVASARITGRVAHVFWSKDADDGIRWQRFPTRLN